MLVLLFLALIVVIGVLTVQLWGRRRDRTRSWWLLVAGLILALAVFISLARSELMFMKIIALLLMPAGLLWMALAGTAVQAWRTGATRQALILSGLFLLHTLAGNQIVGTWLMQRLESGLVYVDPRTVERFDAVCVLGGGTDADAEGHDELGDGGDRILFAARLYDAGKAAHLVASGTEIPHIEGSERNMADQSESLWRGLNIPASVIVKIPAGPINTVQELSAYKTLIAAQGWTRVGVISSAWHLPRAMRLCEKIGLTLIPIPCDHRDRMPALSPFWLIPEASGYSQMQHACWEMLGCLMRR